VCTGNLIVAAVSGQAMGEKVAAWTGIYLDGRIESLWHVAIGGRGMWEAFVTGADTFTRMSQRNGKDPAKR
jgi:hypothetical protein